MASAHHHKASGRLGGHSVLAAANKLRIETLVGDGSHRCGGRTAPHSPQDRWSGYPAGSAGQHDPDERQHSVRASIRPSTDCMRDPAHTACCTLQATAAAAHPSLSCRHAPMHRSQIYSKSVSTPVRRIIPGPCYFQRQQHSSDSNTAATASQQLLSSAALRLAAATSSEHHAPASD